MTEQTFEALPLRDLCGQGNQTDDRASPRISVALCTYNGEKYLREQLDSILNQTVLPYEIVISDDGSTDGTLPIIEDFARTCPVPVRFSQNEENLHFTGNFLHAASLCTGDYVAFSDQDDLWHRRKLEVCSKTAAESGPDLIIHSATVINEEGRRIKNPVRPSRRHPLYSKKFETIFFQYVLGCCFVVRKKVIDEIMAAWDWQDYIKFRRNYGFLMGHDVLVFCWCYGTKNIFNVENALLEYRVHSANVTAVNNVDLGFFGKRLDSLSRVNFNNTKYAKHSEKWRSEAAFINRMKLRANNNVSEGVILFQGYILKRSEIWGEREKIYSPDISVSRKIGAFLYLVKSGSYRPSQGSYGVSYRSLFKDFAVVLRYFLKG